MLSAAGVVAPAIALIAGHPDIAPHLPDSRDARDVRNPPVPGITASDSQIVRSCSLIRRLLFLLSRDCHVFFET